MKNKILPYLSALLIFVVLSCIYMAPELSGKIIAANDNLSWQSSVHECQQYTEQTGNYSFWTGSMFSGMPNYQIGGGQTAAQRWLKPLYVVTHWGQNHSAVVKVLIYFICFFILLLAFGVNPWLSIAGAITIALSSYFFIIIGAAHNSKTSTLALMAAVVGAFYMIYHGQRLWGVVLTMIFVATGFYPHPQMSYYICFIIGFMFLAECANAVMSHEWKNFLISTALFGAAFLVGFGTGATATIANMEYASQTMRGGHSDLVKANDDTNKTKGLDLDYATGWSYGIGETMTLLVPNYMGGSSHYNVGNNSGIYEEMRHAGVDKKTADSFCQAVPTYWGTQPFTAGPVYVGAIVCFLFILGLMIVPGPYKWSLLAVTLLAIMLSWGHNFMPLTRLFFDIVPMYNKFRAVSSILIIAEITMPLLGFLALKRIWESKEQRAKNKDFSVAVLAAGGITAAICIIALLAGLGMSFTSPNDAQLEQYYPQWLIDAIVSQRHSMFNADCLRSLAFALLATILVWAYVKYDKIKPSAFVALLVALILADMWPVDKRYMNDGNFSSASAEKAYFRIQPYEEQILKDKDPNFRVVNLAANTFNDARTSYRLKSVGGYHAAKLRRYQDMIDEHLSKMHLPVYNMLNTKYFIVPDRTSGNPIVQQNPDAMGNAWFVDSLVVVEGANAESTALMRHDLRHTAVVDTAFAKFTGAQYATPLYNEITNNNINSGNEEAKNDSSYSNEGSSITLTSYAPDALEYTSRSERAGTAVFSEIYYPFGWHAYIDGKPAEHFRVNYILRALNIPAGEHSIRFEFRPESVKKGDAISLVFIIILYLTSACAIAYAVFTALKRRKLSNEH